MPVHVFVDESARRRYLLAASVVPATDLAGVRTALRGLLLPGERRVHFQSEGDGRRRAVLVALLDLGVRCRLYSGSGRPEDVRAACLRALVGDFAAGELHRLVLESRGDHLDRLDRHVLAASIPRTEHGRPTVRYEHLAPHEDPALWISDAVAWCHGAGGMWRQRSGALVDQVVDVGAAARRARKPSR